MHIICYMYVKTISSPASGWLFGGLSQAQGLLQLLEGLHCCLCPIQRVFTAEKYITKMCVYTWPIYYMYRCRDRIPARQKDEYIYIYMS